MSSNPTKKFKKIIYKEKADYKKQKHIQGKCWQKNIHKGKKLIQKAKIKTYRKEKLTTLPTRDDTGLSTSTHTSPDHLPSPEQWGKADPRRNHRSLRTSTDERSTEVPEWIKKSTKGVGEWVLSMALIERLKFWQQAWFWHHWEDRRGYGVGYRGTVLLSCCRSKGMGL